MIAILNSELRMQGIVNRVIEANYKETLTGEKELSFTAIIDDKILDLINNNTIFALNDDYFDTSFLSYSLEEGLYTIEVEAEHVSYRLNKEQYHVSHFVAAGTPTQILSLILEDTEFSIGDVEFSETMIFMQMPKTSRRKLLIDFVNQLGGDILFDKFKVNILSHRGSSAVKFVLPDRDIQKLSKTVDKYSLDENGNPTITYICEPVVNPKKTYELGDEILVTNKLLNITQPFRIISMSVNPYDQSTLKLTFGKQAKGLDKTIRDIESATSEKSGVGAKSVGEHAEIFNDYERNVAGGIYSHASGSDSKAIGNYSVAIGGNQAQATGHYAVALGGYNPVASGDYAVALGGYNPVASGDYATAIGYYNQAIGRQSVAIGYGNKCRNDDSYALGYNNDNNSYYGFSSGYDNIIAGGSTNMVLGYNCKSLNTNAQACFIAGYRNEINSDGVANTALGYINKITGGMSSLISGYNNTISQQHSAILGGALCEVNSEMSGILAGYENKITSISYCSSIVGGHNNQVSGTESSIIGGYANVNKGDFSAIISGRNNEIESYMSGGSDPHELSAYDSVILGGYNNKIAQGVDEYGYPGANVSSTIIGGVNNQIGTWYGTGSTIIGGSNNKVGRSYSTAMGQESIAFGQCQFVFGKYNIPDDESQYALIVGGGTSNERKNILTLDWDGNLDISGTITGSVVNGKSPYISEDDTWMIYDDETKEWIDSGIIASGTNGKSAYESALDNGFEGTVEEWLESLKGSNGEDGKTAYEIAVQNGFTGTETEWLESLKGPKGDKGDDGKTAYEIAVQNGFTGTETEWLESLKGEDGAGAVVVDNLTSTSTTSALSANQGRLLNINKVDKVAGKDLSTNDYTNTDKAAVDDWYSKRTRFLNGTGTNAVKLNVSSNSASGSHAVAGGYDTRATGNYSTTFGYGCSAALYGFAVGNACKTQTNLGAVAMGDRNIASGRGACAVGSETAASGDQSFTANYKTSATASYSAAFGNQTQALYTGAFAIGEYTKANGIYSLAAGHKTEAWQYQTVLGKYNIKRNGPTLTSTTSGNPLVIGKGTSESALANCFRVETSGAIYSTGAYNTTGADYAEYFEWTDGNPNNEDRRGLFVTLDGEYIRLANSNDDYILGVISANASVIGDSHEDQWQGMYLYDIYGSPVLEWVEEPAVLDDGNVIQDAYMVQTQKLNPDYDPAKPYVPRSQRKEWSAVGIIGKLIVRDDGTCQANGYCCVADGGIATASDIGYRVLSRIDGAHIKILMK